MPSPRTAFSFTMLFITCWPFFSNFLEQLLTIPKVHTAIYQKNLTPNQRFLNFLKSQTPLESQSFFLWYALGQKKFLTVLLGPNLVSIYVLTTSFSNFWVFHNFSTSDSQNQIGHCHPYFVSHGFSHSACFIHDNGQNPSFAKLHHTKSDLCCTVNYLKLAVCMSSDRCHCISLKIKK